MREAELLLRQRRLVLRSQELRAALARDAGTLVRPLNQIGATAIAVVESAGGAGVPVAALLGLLLARRARGGVRLALRLWGLWQGWRSLRKWLGE